MTTLHVCDLDGTLLGPDARPSDFTRRTVNGLIDSGAAITIATARSLLSLRKVTVGLDLRGPAVVYGGAFVLDVVTGEALVERVLEPEIVDGVLAALSRLKVSSLVYSVDTSAGAAGHADTVGWVAGSESPGLRWYLDDRGADERFRPVTRPDQLRREGTFAIVAIAPEHELLPVAALLGQKFAGRLEVSLQKETYEPSLFWLEVAAPGANKGTGVRALAELTGATRTVVFGDNSNDLPMFEVADEAYAVANALPEVRAAATEVIGSNAADGVAHWLAANARPDPSRSAAAPGTPHPASRR